MSMRDWEVRIERAANDPSRAVDWLGLETTIREILNSEILAEWKNEAIRKAMNAFCGRPR